MATVSDAAQAYRTALDAVPDPPPLAPLGVGSDGAHATARLADLRAERERRANLRRRRQAEIRRNWAILAGRRAGRGEL